MIDSAVLCVRQEDLAEAICDFDLEAELEALSDDGAPAAPVVPGDDEANALVHAAQGDVHVRAFLRDWAWGPFQFTFEEMPWRAARCRPGQLPVTFIANSGCDIDPP